MADNTILNLGSGGDTIATDDIGGVKHQLVKVEWGVADTATPVSAANPMPVVQTGTLATNATLTAETTKVIGTVNVAAAQTLATVTTVGTVSAVTAVGTITPGTAATSLGKAEDAAHTSGDVGVMALTVRANTAVALAGADNEYQPLITDTNGRLHVNVGAGGIAGIVDDAAFVVATSEVLPVGFLADETSTDSVDEGDIGASRMTLDRKHIVATYAHAAGGYTPVSTVSAASTNATSLKASAGTIGAVTVTNINAAMRYLKFYNKASAPTVGTDTPVYVIPLPGNTAGAGATVNFGNSGLNFSTGIAWALTTGPTVADTGAVAVSEIIVSIAYI